MKSAPFYGRVVMGTAFAVPLEACSLVGILFAMAGSLGAWGALGAGFIYDRTGSYDLAWWLAAAFSVALALLGLVRPPRRSSLIGLEPVFKEA